MKESPERLDPIEQFKFDLRTLETKLSALKELVAIGESPTSDDLEKINHKLNLLDEIFEDHKSSFSDSDLCKFEKSLTLSETLLNEIRGEKNM